LHKKTNEAENKTQGIRAEPNTRKTPILKIENQTKKNRGKQKATNAEQNQYSIRSQRMASSR